MKQFIFCFGLLAGLHASGQEIKVTNGFISDSVKVGRVLHFYLTARYPASLNILFPDSSFDYNPFEFIRKTYFTTRTINQMSYDSAVYELTTFEIAPQFSLALPVFRISATDTSRYYAVADTIPFQAVLQNIPQDTVALQQLPLKTNTIQQQLSKHFNYVLAGLLVIALGIFIFIIWMLFGKRIKNYFIARRLRKNYTKFSIEFNNLLGQLRKQFQTTTAEAAATLWKKYVESLTGKPLTRLTTKEIHELLKNDGIDAALRQLDRSIYGFEQTATEPLELLKKQADRFFQEKLQQFSHD
ncbi:MAG: hypothetical protein N2044_06310 [Cyclobacteriaceae bacterium]|nr:hypothetical protein [Cyclobacteriaceae bacterium]